MSALPEATGGIIKQLEHLTWLVKLLQIAISNFEKQYGIKDNLFSIGLEELKQSLIDILNSLQ